MEKLKIKTELSTEREDDKVEIKKLNATLEKIKSKNRNLH